MAKGWSREQSAGIVANLIQESELKPGAIGDSGSSYGIAQWRGSRQKDFEQFAGKGIKGSSFKEQMEFVHHEMTAGEEKAAGARLKATQTASEAGAVVSKYYERPALREEEAAKRGAAAERIARIPDAPRAPERVAGVAPAPMPAAPVRPPGVVPSVRAPDRVAPDAPRAPVRSARVPDRSPRSSTPLPPGAASPAGARQSHNVTADDITVRVVGQDGKPIAPPQTIQTRVKAASPYGNLSGAQGHW